MTSELHLGQDWTDTTPSFYLPYYELNGEQKPKVQKTQDRKEYGKIPFGLQLSTGTKTIPLSMKLTDDFRVHLSWQNSQLGITVKSGSQSKFVPFSTAFE